MKPTEQAIAEFQEIIWRYYTSAGRDLPWRHTDDPYKIMVSEIMLQQTQVTRVIPKYHMFLELFPEVTALASASLEQVLRAWQGLGYNRRARFLWLAAQKVVTEYGGAMPGEVNELKTLPGIGYNTACAIAVYSYNMPVTFVETNIRTVFIHHFFNDQTGVTDKQILELVAQTMPSEHYREWYWAIMDYGSYVKSTVGNLSRSSKHYVKQSVFQGSKRQLRGQVIRLLTAKPRNFGELQAEITDGRLQMVLDELMAEGMIRAKAGVYQL